MKYITIELSIREKRNLALLAGYNDEVDNGFLRDTFLEENELIWGFIQEIKENGIRGNGFGYCIDDFYEEYRVKIFKKGGGCVVNVRQKTEADTIIKASLELFKVMYS